MGKRGHLLPLERLRCALRGLSPMEGIAEPLHAPVGLSSSAPPVFWIRASVLEARTEGIVPLQS